MALNNVNCKAMRPANLKYWRPLPYEIHFHQFAIFISMSLSIKVHMTIGIVKRNEAHMHIKKHLHCIRDA